MANVDNIYKDIIHENDGGGAHSFMRVVGYP